MDRRWTNYVAWLILLMNLICINRILLHNGGRHLLELLWHEHYKYVCPIFLVARELNEPAERVEMVD